MVSSSDAVLTSAAAVAAGLIAFFATWNAVSAQSLGDADQEAKTSKRTAKRIGGVECCADAFDRKVRNRVGQKQEDPSFWRWLLRQCSVGGFDTSKVKHQDGRQGATGGVKSADSQAERGLLAAIGNTPLVRINSLSEATGCEILGKSEFLNPGGSVKDRVAVKIIQEVRKCTSLVPPPFFCNYCLLPWGTISSKVGALLCRRDVICIRVISIQAL